MRRGRREEGGNPLPNRRSVLDMSLRWPSYVAVCVGERVKRRGGWKEDEDGERENVPRQRNGHTVCSGCTLS